MPSKTLTKATASAQALHKLCQTTPNMNAYQRIATSAVEICVAATRGTRNKAQSLATYAVKRTGALITKECSLPLSPERRVDFDAFERTLDDIRQYIETIPGQATRSQKMFSTLKSSRKSALLKAELDRTYHVLSESPQKAATHSPASQIGSILRASAVLSLAVGPCPAMAPLVALICDNGQRSNRAAAMALAQHAQAVTDCIVDRATALPLAGQGDSERALMALRLTLKDIEIFLKSLRTRSRIVSWLNANEDKRRFSDLDAALDRAQTLFLLSEIIGTAAFVRGTRADIAALVANVHRVESNVLEETMGVVQSQMTHPVSPRGSVAVEDAHEPPRPTDEGEDPHPVVEASEPAFDGDGAASLVDASRVGQQAQAVELADPAFQHTRVTHPILFQPDSVRGESAGTSVASRPPCGSDSASDPAKLIEAAWNTSQSTNQEEGHTINNYIEDALSPMPERIEQFCEVYSTNEELNLGLPVIDIESPVTLTSGATEPIVFQHDSISGKNSGASAPSSEQALSPCGSDPATHPVDPIEAAWETTQSITQKEGRVDRMEDALSPMIERIEQFSEISSTSEDSIVALPCNDINLPNKIDSFEQSSQLLLAVLGEISAIHPVVTVLFIAFKSVLSLELKKRDNDRKVMALLTEMKKMLWVLIELKHMKDPERVGPTGATAGGRLQTLLQEIATEIGECGTICKAYVNENRLVKRIRSSKYQGELADFSSKFQQRTEDIKLALGIHTARSTDEINTSIGHVLTNVETMGHKLEMILQRLPPSRFTADQELRTFIEYA